MGDFLMLTQDWLMRQIETMTLAIAKMLFHKDSAQYDPPREGLTTQADFLHAALLALVKEGRYGEAEDLLFDAMDVEDPGILDVANDFYARLNTLTDRELTGGGFSRQEIEEGLQDVMREYGVDLP